MSPVGGSRHYVGAGLGQIGVWGCPSCGEDNTGKLEDGCVHCGAGRPKAAAAPPPPPPAAVEVEPDRESTHAGASVGQPDGAADFLDTPAAPNNQYTAWAERHPEATIEQAFIAGYIEGIRAAQRAHLAQARQNPAAVPKAHTVAIEQPKTYRTMIAALAHFRDQVLAGRPEEVENGEWLSAEDAADVIEQLQEYLHG